MRVFAAFLLSGALHWVVGCALVSSPAIDTWRNPKDDMDFVWIPPGSFMAEIPEKPDPPAKTSVRRVTFSDGYWMGRTEVTVAQYRRFADETGYVTDAEKADHAFTWRQPGFEQEDDHPAVFLSYADALHYTAWADVSLPTELEWVYATRAGATTKFYWGDEIDDRYFWHRENSGHGTHPVARKRPNGWGLYDAVGNAWEWCTVEPTDSTVPNTHFVTQRTVAFPLGGSWTRCALRCPIPTGYRPMYYPILPWDDDRGFRCIKRATAREDTTHETASPDHPSRASR